ncbi:NADH dehydrogenase subunit L [Bryocella elongata]|uniref:NADH dehydrogenase subunit L n=1 Tax=Bryocella elongata TaxID=863522 RepID=A0A1H5VX94_9BACT|nr:NADH-quinone oxidoreductase subunit L [Bryocella elongata]SEF91187.1 NADH dehydrogenase subunit L [Bryocella elongata]
MTNTPWIVRYLWLIPALPLLAGGLIALAKQRHRSFAAAAAIGSMVVAFLLSIAAFLEALGHPDVKQFFNVPWFQVGSDVLKLGWMLDPLTAVMLVMVTLVGTLIFIYSTGYMHEDENFARFFCFLALFAGAMLGVVLSNSLLLLFMCWEIMGLTSYLLIGFWFFKPSAAAAAKKAFLVTRIGDLGFFLGMSWLYAHTGTLLFYDGGAGCLEHSAIASLVAHTTAFGWPLATMITLLLFCGAVGKSGQLPLHVWLPDAMEGPTPVSALIHAATMVAAGVFLMARIYPIASAHALPMPELTPTLALEVVTWAGALTAVFGSLCAVAQFDVKRILAYSTVAQLGYMMMGIGVGGVSVGMFHLITHAFFKALLFLGAGSVIHGCDGEQDIRKMGGLRGYMKITFYAYAAGTLALCGFPLFSGFWSKDEILGAAFVWSISRIPFYLGAFGALLTAFYMTRQIAYVFAGPLRLSQSEMAVAIHATHHDGADHKRHPHESPLVMIVPLILLAFFAVFLGFAGTAAWPWFQSFLDGGSATLSFAAFTHALPLMLVSIALVFLGIGIGWAIYHRRRITVAAEADRLQQAQPQLFALLQNAFYIEPFYRATLVKLSDFLAVLADLFDRFLWGGLVKVVSMITVGIAHLDSFIDSNGINAGFDEGCEVVSSGGKLGSMLEAGRVQGYLRAIGAALIVLGAFLLWTIGRRA